MICLPQRCRGLPFCCVLALLASFNGAIFGAEKSTVSIPPLLLIAPRDSSAIDTQIIASQRRLNAAVMPGPELERLGWLFVAKARMSSDPGFFTLAGVAADALERDFDLPQEAWLLRGHVLQTRHRFSEAEALGRRLVEARGGAADYALLGDALYDEGRVDEAAGAYQRMVDLKPSLDSYARAANIRWVKGDLGGAVQLQTLAVRAGGPGDPGSMAWSMCRLGQLVWQQGDAKTAADCAARALDHVPEFAPALLLKGRVLLAEGKVDEAIITLGRAAAVLPLPETRWVYAEALRVAGRTDEARDLEGRLIREGVAEDPRTVALFLATQGRDAATAVQLARAELIVRADFMTHAVLALALSNAGQMDEAQLQGRAAMAEGTEDARLLLCAGRVAAVARQPEAADLLARAGRLSPLLLPSEQRLLQDSLSLLPQVSDPKDNINQPTQKKTS